jgi:hypothetical protein
MSHDDMTAPGHDQRPNSHPLWAFRDHTRPGDLRIDERDPDDPHGAFKAGYAVKPFIVREGATDEEMVAALRELDWQPVEGSSWERREPHWADTPADRAYAWIAVERVVQP